MGVGAGLYMYDVVVKKFTFAISSSDEFLLIMCDFTIFFYRASYASAVLRVVILSVRLSHACFVTNPKNRSAIFLYRTKGQSF